MTEVMRDTKGRFLNCGNPAGRPKGAKDKRWERFDNFLDKHIDDVLKVSLKLAQQGNDKILCKFIDKFVPHKRFNDIEVEKLEIDIEEGIIKIDLLRQAPEILEKLKEIPNIREALEKEKL